MVSSRESGQGPVEQVPVFLRSFAPVSVLSSKELTYSQLEQGMCLPLVG